MALLGTHSTIVLYTVDGIVEKVRKVVYLDSIPLWLRGNIPKDRVRVIKVIGHQWYWRYEYVVAVSIFELESYMRPVADSDLILLEVDGRIIVPTGKPFVVYTRSTDVIHSFGVPRMFVKIDCIPGRRRFLPVQVTTGGVYYGQCREICGEFHGFMPIGVEAVPESVFYEWLHLG